MKAEMMSDEMLAVLSRRVFEMRDEKFTLEDMAEYMVRSVEEILDILEEAEKRGIISR